MNAQKFTQKSLEAIQTAQSSAIEFGNQVIEQQHVLLALLEQDGGLAPQLLTKMGIDASAVAQEARRAVNDLPHVSGAGREADKVYISNDTDRMLVEAEKTAERMKDE